MDDPQTCLLQLLEELCKEEPDRAIVKEQLRSLVGWVDGGFLPTVTEETGVVGVYRV